MRTAAIILVTAFSVALAPTAWSDPPGHCPPGLAKKNPGCLPPGQAKKLWTIGQPLPAGVVYYPVPPVMLGRLGPAPAGYQYVRVANDVLMLAVGTGLVAAAVADLSGMQ